MSTVQAELPSEARERAKRERATTLRDDFATVWGKVKPAERRRLSLEWVVSNAGHVWLQTIAKRSTNVHGAGLSGLVDSLAGASVPVGNPTVERIATALFIPAMLEHLKETR